MCFTAKSVKCVLQHLSANHERTLWRIQTFAYARIKIVKEKCHFSLYDCDSGVLAVFPFVFQACQSCELDVLIPLQFGCSKLVLVGDPEQLRTTILSQVCL